jgi:hypothetical protein
MKPQTLFPYFGGKSSIADSVWDRLGLVDNFVEPFVGSGAIFFANPNPCTSTLNDASGLMINLWRAIQRDHEAVAGEASKLLGEADLHACELEALAKRDFLCQRCEADLAYFDTTLAGRYLWGLCNKIGSFAVDGGPWINHEGILTDSRKLPHLGDAGKGISRELPHLGNAGKGISRELPHLGSAGAGISRELPHLGNAGREEYILGLMQYYVEKLQHARLTCGDWTRVCKSKSVTTAHGLTGIFLDPPYEKSGNLYTSNGCFWDVVAWAKSEENNPQLRIALAGYYSDDLAEKLEGWEMLRWKQKGGYGGAKNSFLETLFFSPNCRKVEHQFSLQSL